MRKLLMGVGTVACLTGCAGMIESMGRDPVRVEKISASKEDVVATVSLSAEKRNVVVNLAGDRKGSYCAEPPPEVAKALDIDRTALVEGKAKLTAEEEAQLKAEMKEKVKEAITTLGQRTVLLDVYRTGTYSLCQFYINGAIEKTDLLHEFSKLTESVVKALTVTPTK